MMASASRSSGLDIPFLETEPVSREADCPPSTPESSQLEPGALIAGRYRVLRKIGEGGMGVLYACVDAVLSREVAVKLLQRSLAAEPVLAERLMREARLAAQLRHHVAQVFDCGMLDTGEPYIVMELLSGRDLYAVLRESGPLAPAELGSAMLQVCAGLDEAHRKGIVHRDLKPENLFSTTEPDGSVLIKIVDFGVSKQISGRRTRAQTNPTESVGSPQYMSPEQITTPAEVDARTDVWSLGVVMFELLTGVLPFNGPGPAQVCASVLTDPVPPLSRYRNDVPPALEFIVLRCLEKSRDRRFGTAAEVAAALSTFLAGQQPATEPSPAAALAPAPQAPLAEAAATSYQPSTPGSPPRPRRRWIGVAAGVVVLGACVGVLSQGVREGHIKVPSADEIRRVPGRVAAWRFTLPWTATRTDR